MVIEFDFEPFKLLHTEVHSGHTALHLLKNDVAPLAPSLHHHRIHFLHG